MTNNVRTIDGETSFSQTNCFSLPTQDNSLIFFPIHFFIHLSSENQDVFYPSNFFPNLHLSNSLCPMTNRFYEVQSSFIQPTQPTHNTQEHIILNIGQVVGLVRVQGYINNALQDIVIDSGSNASLIAARVIQGMHIQALDKPIFLSGIGKDLVAVRGKVQTTISFYGIPLEHTFLCVDEFKYPVLCGNDFLLPQKIIIDYADQSIKWRGLRLPMVKLTITENDQSKEIYTLQMDSAHNYNNRITRNRLGSYNLNRTEYSSPIIPNKGIQIQVNRDYTLTILNQSATTMLNTRTMAMNTITTLPISNLTFSLNSNLASSNPNSNLISDLNVNSNSNLSNSNLNSIPNLNLTSSKPNINSFKAITRPLFNFNSDFYNNSASINNTGQSMVHPGSGSCQSRQPFRANNAHSLKASQTMPHIQVAVKPDQAKHIATAESTATSRTHNKSTNNKKIPGINQSQIITASADHTYKKEPSSKIGSTYQLAQSSSIPILTYKAYKKPEVNSISYSQADIERLESLSIEDLISQGFLPINILTADEYIEHNKITEAAKLSEASGITHTTSTKKLSDFRTNDILRVGDKTHAIPSRTYTPHIDISQYSNDTQQHILRIFSRINPASTPEEKKAIETVLVKYHDVFKNSTSIESRNVITAYTHTIKVKPNIVPYASNPIPKPFEKMEFERKTIKDLLEAGKIEPSSSPFAAPILIVPKKGHQKYRAVVDFRYINQFIIDSGFPICTIEIILHWLANRHKHMSLMDFASGYHQVGLDEASRDLLSFVSFEGQFRPTVIFYGAKDAAKAFCKAMNKIFVGLLFNTLMLYMDDIIFADNTLKQHLTHLEAGFLRIREANALLEPSKCNFNYQKLTILGHIIDQTGVSISEEKTVAVLNAPAPRNKKATLRFLGMVGWFRRSIPKLSIITKPLYALCKDNTPFIWGQEQQNAFLRLKEILTSPPLLHWFDETRPIILVVDASISGCGACILQQTPEGEIVPVAYHSSSLTPAQTRYPAVHLEFLSLATALKTFNVYLAGRYFKIYTDSQPISHLKYGAKNKRQETRFKEWSITLADYDFDIIYRPGKYHQLADWLSRDTNPSNYTDEQSLEPPDTLVPNPFRNQESNEIPILFNHISNLNEVQLTDPTCLKIINQLHAKDVKTLKRFALKDNILVNLQAGYSRPYIPKAMITTILDEFHASPAAGGHSGYSKTLMKIQQRFFWTTMRKDTYDYVSSCDSCTRLKRHHGKIQGMPGAMPIPNYPTEIWAADIIGPLTPSSSKNLYVINAICLLSKWAEWQAIPDITANTVAKFFENRIFLKFSTPRQIIMDNGTQFISQLVHSHAELFKVKMRHTSLYNSRSNSTVERNNQTVSAMVKHYAQQNYKAWDKNLHALNFCYNSTPHTALGGKSPFEILYARQPNFPNQFQLSTDVIQHPYDILRQQEDLQQIWDFVRQTLRTQQDKSQAKLAAGHKPVSYELGDIVKLHYPKSLNKTPQSPKKWIPYYFGTYKIITKYNDLTYKVQCMQTNRTFMSHVRRMRLVKHYDNNEPEENFDLCLNRETFIDSIIHIHTLIKTLKQIEYTTPVEQSFLEFEIHTQKISVMPSQLSEAEIKNLHFTRHRQCTIITLGKKVSKHSLNSPWKIEHIRNSKNSTVTIYRLEQPVTLNSFFKLLDGTPLPNIIFSGLEWHSLAFKYMVTSMLKSPMLPSLFHLATKFIPFISEKPQHFYQEITTFAYELHTYAKQHWNPNISDIENRPETELVDQTVDSDEELEQEDIAQMPAPAQPPIRQIRRSQRNRQQPIWMRDYVRQ
jgi:hypothetical protein